MVVVPKASHIQGKYYTTQLHCRSLFYLECDEFEVRPKRDWRSKGEHEGKKGRSLRLVRAYLRKVRRGRVRTEAALQREMCSLMPESEALADQN